MTDIWLDSLPSQMLLSRNSAPNFEGLAGVSCWPDPICANAGQCWRANGQQRGLVFIGGDFCWSAAHRGASWRKARNSMILW